MASLRFDGKVVLVTGAGGGLGRAYALEFAKRGAKVVVNDLGGSTRGEGASTSAADKVVQEIKSAGGVAVADYNSVVDGGKIVKTALDAFGRIDVVVNNAGILRDVSFSKMTDADWSLLQQVHLNGTHAVTKAAWPHMLKQKFGRIIMVTSAAGLYGNHGQSHYSAVKMGILGFGNTLALEGAKSNVLTNTIAPLAGSRMTETVMPKDLVDALKPDYVAPLVLYLCHESSSQNGGIFEVGAGWISKVRWQRTKGVMFPLNENFTAEAVAQQIEQVNDFSNATFPTTTRDAFGPIMENLNSAGSPPAPMPEKKGAAKKAKGADVDVAAALAAQYPETKYSYSEKDVVLYNLGIGAASDPLDPSELNFCYEGAENFAVIPTFGVIPPSSVLGHVTSIPGMSFNPMMLLHGEQYLEVIRPIPTSGTLTSKAKIAGLYDKGSGALVHLDVRTYNERNEDILFNRYSLFIRGQGGFGGEKGPKEAEPTHDPPAGIPPAVVHRERTQENQAALYRLSGDYNPLHVDPGMAKMGNFDRPILHGLCTFGYAARAVLKHFANNDPKRFQSIRARFVKSVYPGETLVTEMWPTEGGNTIVFRVRVAERGEIVLASAAIKLHPLPGSAPAPAAAAAAPPAASKAPVAAAAPSASPSPSPAAKKSSSSFAIEPVFNELRSRASADLVSKVKASFRFDISKDKDSRSWLLDLKTGEGALTEVDQSAKADCIIAMKDEDCVKLFAGQLNAQQAFMKGQIKIKGNMMLAQKLQLLQNAKSKL